MRILGPILALSLLAVAVPAAADVIPPAESACESSRAGASCTVDGASGECVESTCSRLDYARWDGGGDGPPTTTYDCLVCEAGGASDDGGGCAVGATGAGAGGGAVVVALALVLGALLARRRR